MINKNNFPSHFIYRREEEAEARPGEEEAPGHLGDDVINDDDRYEFEM